MPLVRFEVRNEYGLGDPELYRGSAKKEDSKALLDGVAVAGLVGILRQLGDLAELAADVFHDLHEQVTATAGRGRKMLTRVKNIEAALPSLEKAIQGPTSHIHFAYVAGCDWHAHLQNEQSHLLFNELPPFMMDSYEECRDPPRLYLLDKFDNAGAGACLKRYSDPSYFRRVWVLSESDKGEHAQKEKKALKFKAPNRLLGGTGWDGPTNGREKKREREKGERGREEDGGGRRPGQEAEESSVEELATERNKGPSRGARRSVLRAARWPLSAGLHIPLSSSLSLSLPPLLALSFPLFPFPFSPLATYFFFIAGTVLIRR